MRKIILTLVVSVCAVATAPAQDASRKELIRSAVSKVETTKRLWVKTDKDGSSRSIMTKFLLEDYVALVDLYAEDGLSDKIDEIYEQVFDVVVYERERDVANYEVINHILLRISDFYQNVTKQPAKAERVALTQLNYIESRECEVTVEDYYTLVCSNLAFIWMDLGKYDEAERLLNRVIRMEGMNARDSSFLHQLLATLLSLENRYEEAIPMLERALHKSSDEQERVELVKQIVGHYRTLGDIENANSWNERLLSKHRDTLSYIEFGQLLAQDDFDTKRQIDMSRKRAEISRRRYGENSMEYAGALFSLASAIGSDYPRDSTAINTFASIALDIIKQHTPSEAKLYATNISEGVWNFINVGRYDVAETVVMRYLLPNLTDPILSEELQLEKKDNLYGLLIEIKSRSGQYAEAVELGSNILNELRNEGEATYYDRIIARLNKLGEIHIRGENYSAAEKVLTEALLLADKYHYDDLLPTIVLLFNVYQSENRLADAAAIAEKGLSHIRSMVRGKWAYMAERQRETYWEQYGFVSMYLSRYLYYGNSAEMIRAWYSELLFYKGLLLNSSIELGQVLAESESPSLLQKYNDILEISSQLDKSPTDDSLMIKKERLEYELIKESRSFGDYTRNLQIGWEDVRGRLSARDVAIEFVDFFDSPSLSTIYAALVLRKEWDAPRMVTLFEKGELDKLIGAGGSKFYSGYVGKQITKLVWEPLAEYINEGNNVYFSPSGVLHHLAIESLPTEDGRLMGELYNLHRLSSTKQLCFDRTPSDYNKAVLYGGLTYDLDENTMVAESRAYTRDALAMRGFEADSLYRDGWAVLPGTKREVENISAALAQNDIQSAVFEGQTGNEESFRTLSGQNNQIVHIATHGFFLPLQKAQREEFFRPMDGRAPQPDNSMRRSGLMLSGGNRAWRGEPVPEGVEDGVLTAQEIASLDLRGADLVVLSACETGLGEVTGEGVFGLQRAFKKAGAQTLVMSLLKVSDAATEVMMSEFYANLLVGKSKRESFLAAQAAVRAKFPEPHYWAAFIMLD